MNAREELFNAFKPWTLRPTPDGVNALIDAFAHELAEKIRANVDMRGADLADATDAADFIDPEVRKES